MLILPNENILLEYVVSMRLSFVLHPDCSPTFPGSLAAGQADGIEVSSLPLPLLDLQWLLAGLGTWLIEVSHPGDMQPVTISVLTALSADYVGCPSLPFQMIFFHMFEIFYRLDRKSSRQLHQYTKTLEARGALRENTTDAFFLPQEKLQ